MDRTRVEYDGVTFLGATLWTDLTGHETMAQECMNDYSRIHVEDTGLIVPADVTAWHRRDRAWIRSELDLPLRALISARYPCFATDCTEFMRPPVTVLIAGHTHAVQNISFVASDLSLIQAGVNPRG